MALTTTTVSISFQDLSSERTLFQISRKEKDEIKGKIEKYLDWLKQEYPNTKADIEKEWNDKRISKEWNEYSDETEIEDWLTFIRRFTEDGTIVESIKEEAKESLKKAFLSNDLDTDVIKDLKTQPIDGLLDEFLSYQGDDIAYATELCKKFYLGWLSKYIEKGLSDKNLTLNDLEKGSWEHFRQKIFTDLYDSWSGTDKESEIEKLQKKLEADIVELSNLIETAADLKAAKIKYKKERTDGKPWSLTDSEKTQIDQATNKQDLEKIVKGLMDEKDTAERKIKGWIKENISDKTKKEDLPSEADIDSNPDIPSNFKEQTKQALWEKEIELMPETTIEGKIKKHLTKTLYDWKRWGDVVENGKKEDKDYLTSLSFSESFKDSVAKEMKLKIEEAIKTDTIEGYEKLDKEWGEDKLDEKGEVKYNAARDFLGDWNTLETYLKELKTNEAISKYEKMKAFLIINHFGEARWQEIEINAQIEVKKSN